MTHLTDLNPAVPSAPDASDLRARYAAALSFDAYLDTVVENAQLWRDAARLARLSDGAAARAAALPGRWHLLVLSEDWCGDAVNTVPFVARLADAAPALDVRVLGRDANPDVIDAHLTSGSRSIPIVIAYDESFREHAWWGPRPTALQAWVMGEGQALDKAARYRHVRTWYARDRGRTTLDEVLRMLEGATGPNQA